MIYEILLSESARNQLKKLDYPVQERILYALERIRIKPERYVKKLVGDPAYRLRVGDYRVLLDIDKSRLLVLVIKIGHRRDIYTD